MLRQLRFIHPFIWRPKISPIHILQRCYLIFWVTPAICVILCEPASAVPCFYIVHPFITLCNSPRRDSILFPFLDSSLFFTTSSHLPQWKLGSKDSLVMSRGRWAGAAYGIGSLWSSILGISVGILAVCFYINDRDMNLGVIISRFAEDMETVNRNVDSLLFTEWYWSVDCKKQRNGRWYLILELEFMHFGKTDAVKIYTVSVRTRVTWRPGLTIQWLV